LIKGKGIVKYFTIVTFFAAIMAPGLATAATETSCWMVTRRYIRAA